MLAAVVRRMRVRRLVVQSTIGTGESREHLTFYWRRLMFGALLRQEYLDHVRQEELVQRTDLDWTIVRPSAFTDADQPGVRHGFGGYASARGGTSSSRTAAGLLQGGTPDGPPVRPRAEVFDPGT